MEEPEGQAVQAVHEEVLSVENELERGKELDEPQLDEMAMSVVKKEKQSTAVCPPLAMEGSLTSNGSEAMTGTGPTDEWVRRHQGNKEGVAALVQRFNKMAEGEQKGSEHSKS